MILTLRCAQERQADGSYRIVPRSSTAPFVLSGNTARLWEVVAAIAACAPDEQDLVFRDLDPELRPRVVSVLSRLERAGALDVRTPAGRRALARPLRTLHLEITHRCNFACRACYLGPALARAGASREGEAATSHWLELIRQAAELGCTSAVVTGGEPFVRGDVLEIVAALRAHGIRCEINTNASCITDAVAQALFEASVWGVEVSVYGYDAASAAGYTRVRGGYAATLTGVRRLAARGVPVQVKYFATAATLDGFDDVKREFGALGVPVVCKGHAIHGDIFQGRLPEEGVRSRLTVPELVQEDPLPCTPGIDGLVIDPRGQVRACPKIGLPFGNAFEDGLAAVWESAQLEAFGPFWTRYCEETGFVRGARVHSRCPAATMLSRPTGLGEFKARWDAWRAEGHA